MPEKLVPCRICGAEVAPRAPRCPKCGTKGPTNSPLEQGLHDTARVSCALGCLLILAVPVIIFGFGAIAAVLEAMFGGG